MGAQGYGEAPVQQRPKKPKSLRKVPQAQAATSRVYWITLHCEDVYFLVKENLD
jgi:hypothetical protein